MKYILCRPGLFPSSGSGKIWKSLKNTVLTKLKHSHYPVKYFLFKLQPYNYNIEYMKNVIAQKFSLRR